MRAGAAIKTLPEFCEPLCGSLAGWREVERIILAIERDQCVRGADAWICRCDFSKAGRLKVDLTRQDLD